MSRDVVKKDRNSLTITSNILSALSTFSKDVELSWGLEEKTRAESCMRSIDVLLRDNGISWNEVLQDEQRKSNIISVIKQVVFLKLNPDAVPREVFFSTRNKKVGEDDKGKPIYKKFIESALEGSGNDTVLRNFGVDVKDIKNYIVYDGDEFSGVFYDGFDVKLPKYKPKVRAFGEAKGKALYSVYLIKKKDLTIDVSISEREDVKQSLLAHIRQNGASEEYIAKLSNYTLDNILDGNVPDATFLKEKKVWNAQSRRYDIKKETLTLQDLISPAWRSAVSREKMIERKMRNHATRRYPKDFSNKAVQDLYEDTFEDEKYERRTDTTPSDMLETNEQSFIEHSGSQPLNDDVDVDLEIEVADEIEIIDEKVVENDVFETKSEVSGEIEVDETTQDTAENDLDSQHDLFSGEDDSFLVLE